MTFHATSAILHPKNYHTFEVKHDKNFFLPLTDYVSKSPGSTQEKGHRHPLASMLALTVIGLLCGQRSSTAIAKWARIHPDLRETLGFTAKQTPAASTFHYLYRCLDITAVEKTLTQWTTHTLARLPTRTSRLKGIADGKTLGNSDTQDARKTHLLAVVSHELGIPLAECAVSEKTNEIPISIKLLKAFDVAGRVTTTDALLTQRKFCQAILDQHADYCLPVKANQKQLYEDIRDLFEPFDETDPIKVEHRRFENLHAEVGAHLQTHTDTETTKGRVTTRTLTASTLLTQDTDWPGLQQVYQYTTHQQQKNTGQVKCHVQYGITSLPPNAPQQLTCSNSGENIGRLRINSIGSEMWSLERMPQGLELKCCLKSWQRCETPHSLFYDSPDIRKSLTRSNVSQRNLNSQLTL